VAFFGWVYRVNRNYEAYSIQSKTQRVESCKYEINPQNGENKGKNKKISFQFILPII